jgi:mRNA interferase RelE/StbE
VTYRIVIAPTALKMLKGVPDRRVRELIVKRIDELKKDPEKQGKALIGELAGYRSLRAAGQRYRIIYRVGRAEVVVYIVAVGIRKEGGRTDIYQLAKKLIRLRLIESCD